MEHMNKTFVYEEYDQLINGMFHYQEQQIELRVICLKFMVACFAIIGLLAFSNIGLSNFWFIIISGIIPILFLFIITINFFHDLIYKERLKLGFFFEAIKLEKSNGWLPEFHKTLVGESYLRNSHNVKQASFYLVCLGILLLLSGFSFFFLPTFSNIYGRALIIVLVVVFFFIFCRIFSSQMNKTKELYSYDGKTKKRIINKDDDFLLSRLHAKGKEYIEHFSKLKMRYKNLAITILTGAFVAIAYVVASQTIFFSSKESIVGAQEKLINQNFIYIISFTTLLFIIGMNLIRFLDVHVSHEQIRGLFKYMISMEKNIKELSKPYVVISQTLYKKKFDPVVLDFLFYGTINFGVIVFSCIAIISYFRNYHSYLGIYLSLAVLAICLIWECALFFILYKKPFIGSV